MGIERSRERGERNEQIVNEGEKEGDSKKE